GLDITRIAGNVRGKHGLFTLRRGSHQASTNGNVMLDVDVFFKADRKAVYQLLLGGIQQQDGKHVVINDLQQKITDALKQLVNVQDRRKISADLVQQCQRARLPDDARVQSRIFNAHG